MEVGVEVEVGGGEVAVRCGGLRRRRRLWGGGEEGAMGVGVYAAVEAFL